MKYILKNKDEVTKDEILQLQFLHLIDGFCWGAFLKEEGNIIICRSGDEILGWAFIYKDDRREDNTFFVYIKKEYRRLGIGKKLYEIAIKKYKKLWTSKFNKKSRLFFESVE